MSAQNQAVRRPKVQAQPGQITRQQQKQARSIRQRPQVNGALRSACLVLFLITTAMTIFFLIRSGMAAESAYALNQIKSKANVLESDNARLRLDIAQLKSPERIQAIAVQELGMIMPDKFFFSTKNK